MMFKLALICTLVVASYCMPADKDKSDHPEQPETSWNSPWAHPSPSAINPNAGVGAWQNHHQWGGANANNWNRWGNPATAADPRWNQQNRWGSNDQPRNRWGAGSASASGSQWNRPGQSWAAAGVPTTPRWNSQ